MKDVNVREIYESNKGIASAQLRYMFEKDPDRANYTWDGCETFADLEETCYGSTVSSFVMFVMGRLYSSLDDKLVTRNTVIDLFEEFFVSGKCEHYMVGDCVNAALDKIVSEQAEVHSGETRSDFAQFLIDFRQTVTTVRDHFGIPYRTVQNWSLPVESSNYRKCPDYVLNMMKHILDGIDERDLAEKKDEFADRICSYPNDEYVDIHGLSVIEVLFDEWSDDHDNKYKFFKPEFVKEASKQFCYMMSQAD